VPKVGVVIPSYNSADFVSTAVESVLAQSMGDYEIVVVNDGSTDKTEEVLAPYVESGKIRVVRQENRGLPAARNAGARACETEYLAFLDSDDTLAPDALRLMSCEMDSTAASWCLVDVLRIKGEEAQVQSSRPPAGNYLHGILREQYIWRAMFYRRQTFFEMGSYDESMRYMEDWDLYIRMFEKQKAFGYISQPLYRYVWREGSLITRKRQILEYTQKIFRKHHKRIADAGDAVAAQIYAAQMWNAARCFLHDHKEYGRALGCVRESLAYEVNPSRIFHPIVHHAKTLLRPSSGEAQ
jgi:glycosyltransferase involved in cell wall biosynthesis